MSTKTNAPTIGTITPGAQPRIFHTLLTFRCPSSLSEKLAVYAAKRGTKSISRVIRELLDQALALER